jgi:hypothetical protein
MKHIVELLLEHPLVSETKLGSEHDGIARRAAHPAGALQYKQIVLWQKLHRKGESNNGLRSRDHVTASARPIPYTPTPPPLQARRK